MTTELKLLNVSNKQEGGRERERAPRKPQNDGGPYGPGSLNSSSNPKEEERERGRERRFRCMELSPLFPDYLQSPTNTGGPKGPRGFATPSDPKEEEGDRTEDGPAI